MADLKSVSANIFAKNVQNALSSAVFAAFLTENAITDLYITGADATACVKSTCLGLRKAGYGVTVLSDCITSYNTKKIDEMLRYYEGKGCEILKLSSL